MSSYEQRLTEFSQGKRLLRLPRPILDQVDTCCDACGSTRPRTFYALKDVDAGRYYFVGNTCLKEIAKLGAVLKRYGRESGQRAYENEMKLRSREVSEGHSNEPALIPPEAPTRVSESASAKDGVLAVPDGGSDSVLPVLVLIESQDHYRVTVSVVSSSGITELGYAQEARHQETWGLGGEQGLVLERTSVERLNALDMCLARALAQAIDKYPGLKSLPIPRIETAKLGGTKCVPGGCSVLSSRSELPAHKQRPQIIW